MKFDMVAPCVDCPFRTDVKPYLRTARADEILNAITRGQKTFACHKTVVHGEDDEDQPVHIPSVDEQHCAGALILLEKIDQPNQMMRISERIGAYDRRKLKMDSPVYATPAAMRKAYRNPRAIALAEQSIPSTTVNALDAGKGES